MRTSGPDRKFRRQERVVGLIKMEIDAILRREVKDPRVKKLTITEVIISPDFRNAEISVCRFMGDEISPDEIAEILEGLKSASHFIYESLKRRLVMKVIPSLKFSYDNRLSQVAEVWNITRRLQDNAQGAVAV